MSPRSADRYDQVMAGKRLLSFGGRTLLLVLTVLVGCNGSNPGTASASDRQEGKLDSNSPLLGSLPSAAAVKYAFGGAAGAAIWSVVPIPGMPQGPLSREQILHELGHNGAFTSAFEKAHGGAGAGAAYETLYHGKQNTGEYQFVSIKFPTELAGEAFASAYLATMKTVGGAQFWAGQTTSEHGYGVLSATQRGIYYIVPTSAFGNPLGTTSVEQILYPNGTYFLLTAIDYGSQLAWDDAKIGGYAQLIDVTFELCTQHPSSCPNRAGA
jgi:hypothetical protein